MGQPETPPVGVSRSADVEYRPDRRLPYRARVRWIDPVTKRRKSRSESFAATMSLAEYGDAVMPLALRGLGAKTRVVHAWIADECSRPTVKNSLAMLVRVMEQAVRDGIIDRNPAKVTGWQREYQRAEDELDDPRSLALPDWDTLMRLAAALVERSADHYAGWGEMITFAACTAARIGEVSGVRKADIDRDRWIWTVRRQTTPGPGGLIDKATKGKRARKVPIIEEARELVAAWTWFTYQTADCSPALAAAGSLRRSCAMRPIGTRW